MRTIQQLIYLSLLFLFISTISYATNYYVDNNASGQNNGTSWANAWTSFSAINWGSIQPGDIIYISGGVDSTVYTSGLTIGKSGTAGNYIYLMPGKYAPSPANHSGKVIMTPSGSGITNSGGYDYIYIKGITIRDFGGRGVYMWNGTSHIVLDSLTIMNGGEMGTWWEESSYIEIKNCTVISQTNNLNTDDNNYGQRIHHFYIHHNYFHMRNRQFGTGTDHLDNFQVADWGYAFYFYNNVCITDSAVQGHNIILGCKGNTANYSDTVLVFNNFFYDGGDPGCNYQRSVYFRYPESGGSVYQGYLVNNTIVTANWGAPVFDGEGGRVYVSNNIMVNMGVNGTTPGSCENGNWTWGQNGASSAYYVRVDSCHTNLAWRKYNANPSFYGSGFVRTNGTHGTPSSWNDFVTNYGGTGVNNDPKFAGNWRLGKYELQSSSPAIDAGTNMLYYLNKYVGYLPDFDPTTDIEGNPRGSTWGIGAYEFINGGGGNNPPNQPSNPTPVNGSINQPVNLSLTWSCIDPDGDPLNYDVYFGTNNNPSLVSTNQSNASYDPGQLNSNTTYYWKIIAKDNQGASTSGSIWNFTTTYLSNYYVDKNASGQNNGTSWANAWTSFSAINWNSIQPGDIIYISGGTDSTVYYERLVIGKSGTAGNYITIRNSYEAGHNGKVIIEDPNTNTFDGCIYLSNRDWVYIKGIETRKGIRALYLWTQCDYVTIDSCIFKNWYTNGSNGGVKIEGNDNFPDGLNCTNIEIKNCTVISLPLYDLNETDCIYGQGVLKLRIHDNFIHQRNQSTNNMHVDCIQLYRTADVRIWNNVCIVDSGVTGHGMILGVESRANNQDTMIVYNNYIYAGGHLLPGGDPYINAGYCRWYGENYHPLSYWINNTIVTANGGESPLVMEYMPFFKNNIIVQYGTNGVNPSVYGGEALETVTSTDPAWCGSCNPPLLVEQSNNNLMWREWAGVSFIGEFSGNGNTGTPTSWSEWVNTYGGTGINVNPLFVNNVRERYGYAIASNSPARNAGGDLQAFVESKGLPWTDIEGKPRDSSPDIGAYEYDYLPVELTSFTATSQIGRVILNWATATETNNLGFEIDRKQDNSEWENIGFVEGHGTTIEPKEYIYIDDISTVRTTSLVYRLKQINFDGSFEYSDVVEVEVVPIQFELSQNYPNPFNPSTTIRFSLPTATQLKINIYNMIGEQVATLAEGMYESGYHKVTFNASSLPTGTYIYRLESNEFIQTKKMMLLK